MHPGPPGPPAFRLRHSASKLDAPVGSGSGLVSSDARGAGTLTLRRGVIRITLFVLANECDASATIEWRPLPLRYLVLGPRDKTVALFSPERGYTALECSDK